ncbi:DUF4241 domain-containing protein [Streptomyces virginiae]|uniref:DUF4241 domain-containing protein n=1 Tax=Streptomyces virginiae TaxID=1961 RepID=UPI0036EE5643
MAGERRAGAGRPRRAHRSPRPGTPHRRASPLPYCPNRTRSHGGRRRRGGVSSPPAAVGRPPWSRSAPSVTTTEVPRSSPKRGARWPAHRAETRRRASGWPCRRGTYPVKAPLVEVTDQGHGSCEEVAAVRLQLGDAAVAAWEMALGPPGDDTLRSAFTGGAFGFGTDGATGAFADAGVRQDLRDQLEPENRQVPEGRQARGLRSRHASRRRQPGRGAGGHVHRRRRRPPGGGGPVRPSRGCLRRRPARRRSLPVGVPANGAATSPRVGPDYHVHEIRSRCGRTG